MTYALAWPLQQGIFQQLTGDRTLHAMVGERIYDGTPPFGPEAAPEGPYITLGDDTAEDWSTVTGHGALHRVLISVYAPRRGFSDAKQVAGAVCDALIDAQIALSRGHVVNIGFLSAQSARLENDALRRIDMRFRITIEDTAI